ncbi:MAG: MFS transporter [Eggerthellaceae bacterium]|nr:MFS transporter [Eggerthellaceae bacterium]
MPEGEQKLLSKGFVECVIIQFLGYMAFGMTMPVLPMHIVNISGSTVAAGAITGMFAFCALVMRPFSGYVADRTNKRTLQTFGLLACAVGSAGYALAPGLGWLIGVRIVHSIGFVLQSTVTIAITLSMVPKGREGEAVGYFSLTQVVTTATAPLVGVALAETFGCPITFLADAACVTLGALLSTRVPYKSVIAPKGRGLHLESFISMQSVPLAAVAALFAVCSGITSGFIVLLCDNRGIAGAALFFTVSAVLMFFTRPKAGKIIDRKGIRPVLMPTFFFESAVMLLIAFASNVWFIIVAGLLRAFGQGMAQPSVQAEIMRQEGKERSGVASSTFNLGLDLGQGVGALFAGWIAGLYGYGAAFAACPFFLAVALAIFLVNMHAGSTKTQERG